MFLPANWRGIEKLIYAFRAHYEPELAYLKQVLSPGSTFIDAGACYGVYALAGSTIVGRHGRVIAFEPASRAFRVFQHNLELNGVTNVRAYRAALTEKQGKAWLYRHPNVGCDSLGRDRSFTDSGEEVATESLDDVLRQFPAKSVDVMLQGLGYQFFVVENDETLTQVESPPINRNVVAISSQRRKTFPVL